MTQNGKGDTYRPVDPKKWTDNYERIFGQKKESKKEPEKKEQQ